MAYIPFPSTFPISDQTDYMSCNDLFQQMFDPRNRQLLQQDQELPMLSEATNTDQITSKKRRRKSDDHHQENFNDNKKKRIVHRDIERQRRQEMATLYRALRSQLPLEYLKGKRSVSDHMNEAVNYIKHLKSKIEELSDKRAHLRKLSDPDDLVDDINVENHESECCGDEDDTVTVSSCRLGVEIVVSTSATTSSSMLKRRRDQKLALSSVLKVLVEEGLSVVSSVSTRVNERLFHTIKSQVIDDGRRIDMLELQKKLTNIAPLSYSD